MMRFPSKLLLFGEHVVLKGASALAIPFDYYGGSWKYNKASSEQKDLPDFLYYLKKLATSEELILHLDLGKMERELDAGLYFESDIPVGYGLGSSGAICAAVNSKFGEPPSKLEIRPLQLGLAQMESFYHGSSSGTDPLVSYLKVPLMLTGTKIYPPLWQAHTEELLGSFFLLDSQKPREAAPLIQEFLQQSDMDGFYSDLKQSLIPATERAIKNLLSGDRISLADNTRQISRFQQAHMSWMILPELNAHWLEGLERDHFYLKVCGAGGGGYYIGFAKDIQATQEYFEQQKIPLLWLAED